MSLEAIHARGDWYHQAITDCYALRPVFIENYYLDDILVIFTNFICRGLEPRHGHTEEEVSTFIQYVLDWLCASPVPRLTTDPTNTVLVMIHSLTQHTWPRSLTTAIDRFVTLVFAVVPERVCVTALTHRLTELTIRDEVRKGWVFFKDRDDAVSRQIVTELRRFAQDEMEAWARLCEA